MPDCLKDPDFYHDSMNLHCLAFVYIGIKEKKPCKRTVYKVFLSVTFLRGGERGIRTPGTLPYNGFQDHRIRPLCHLSSICASFASSVISCDNGCKYRIKFNCYQNFFCNKFELFSKHLMIRSINLSMHADQVHLACKESVQWF